MSLIITLIFMGVFTFVLLIFCAFWFSRTGKNIPKSWYDWKMELHYQYVGIVAIIDDFLYRRNDRVELYRQPDRIAVITGGNRGIGLRVAEKLINCDMIVIMGIRDAATVESSIKSELKLVPNCQGQLICENLDMASLASVKQFAEKIKNRYSKIDILINNAGIMFAPYALTLDGFESHFAVNYLGHFLLQHMLLPELKAAGRAEKKSRIVNVSSCAHLLGTIKYADINAEQYYSPAFAYSQSKLAQILSTRHLQQLLNSENAPVQVIALHPGIVNTDLFEYSSTTSVPFFKRILFKTPEQGSRTPVFAAISPKIEGEGGIYLSNCRRGRLHPMVLSNERCEKFFQFSCELLNIDKFGEPQ